MKPRRTDVPVEQSDKSRWTSIPPQVLTCEMQCSLHQVFPSHLFFQLLVLFSQKFNVLHMKYFICHAEQNKQRKNPPKIRTDQIKAFWVNQRHVYAIKASPATHGNSLINVLMHGCQNDVRKKIKHGPCSETSIWVKDFSGDNKYRDYRNSSHYV